MKNTTKNTTTIGNFEIAKGKVDFTKVSDLGNAIISNFADGNFNVADKKYPLQVERANVRKTLKMQESLLEQGKATQEQVDKTQEEIDAISLKLQEIDNYKFTATDKDKASYDAYKVFMQEGTEESQEQFAQKLGEVFTSLGLELTNGGLIAILQRVGLRKATVKQMATERQLVKVASRGQFYYQVYSFLAEGLNLIG